MHTLDAGFPIEILGEDAPPVKLAMSPSAAARAERTARWIEMARQGMSAYEIGAKEGVAASQILRAFSSVGLSVVELKRNGGARKQRKEERARKVNEIYQREGSLEAAGKVLGITRERVRQILVSGGLMERIDRVARNSPKPEQIAAARHDFDHGLGVDAIAFKHGVSVARARELLRASGLQLQKSLGRRKRMFSYEEVRAKYESGVRAADLAVEYGKDVAYIYRAIAKAGGVADGRCRHGAA